jgi:YegS/Rv2252/BmrU family lipid kinase
VDYDQGTILFIANPRSGATSRQRVPQRFHDFLLERGLKVTFTFTAHAGHACDLAHQAAQDPQCTLVVCAGGDGTLREVAEGLQGSPTPLLIIPAGTENLLAGELGYDERLSTIISTFEEGYARPLDLGTLNGKCFTCVMGVGFDADVVRHVHRKRNGHIDYFDYIDPLWQTFWSHTFPVIDVAIDDEPVYRGQGMVYVGNVSRYAGGLKILRHAHYGDGLLDLCIYRCANRLHLVKHVLFTLAKQHARSRDVLYRQGKKITITTPSANVPSEVDGDPGPSLPLEIRVVPQALQVLTRQHAKPAGIRTRLLRTMG